MRLKKNVLIEKLGDVGVAFDNDTSTLHEFNELGYFILKLLESGVEMDEIVKVVMDEYEVDVNQAKRDVENFLNQLEKKDLIEE